MKKKVAIIISVVIVLTMALALAGCDTIKTKVSTHTVGNGKDLTIGVISDTQLNGKGIKDNYYYNYVSALKTLKDVDTIMFVGDLTDVFTKQVVSTASDAWIEAFGSMDKGPIRNYIMGNHDFWLPNFSECWEIPSKSTFKSRFKKATGEDANSHKVINGYHFINASPNNGDMEGAYDKMLPWLEKEIKAAIADNGDNPIFVNTHFAPRDTVEASYYGEAKLHELFKKYPQIVSLSGHSHASLMSERSLWQGEYTAIQTQSLSYTCFEGGDFENNFEYEGLPTGMIIKLAAGKMTIDRIDIRKGEKIASQWSLDLPIKENLDKYSTTRRSEEANVPTFSSELFSSTRYNGKFYFSFVPAQVNSVTKVKYYEVRIKDEKTQEYIEFDMSKGTSQTLTYLSDFYEAKQANSVLLEFKRSLPRGDYEVEVVAVEEFGKKSEAIFGKLYIA